MIQHTYRILKLLDATGVIRGRKKLQKMVHLLKSAGMEFPFNYQYHHYGPYSAPLQETMNHLIQQNYIEERLEAGAYVYQITDEGKQFKTLLETKGKYSFAVDEDVMKALLEKNSQFLEVVSTYVFLLESGDTSEEAKAKTLELKPHLVEYVDDAIHFYEQQILQ